MAVCTCRALVVGVRGRGAGEEGTAPFLYAGASSLHDVCANASGPRFGCGASLAVCGSSWAMESGCGGVWRMESCRGGCGVGVGARPCLDRLPSARLDGGPPSSLRGCADACRLCYFPSRASGLSRAWLADVYPCRGCDAWKPPSQRVAPVTMACRCCAPGGALVPVLGLWWAVPLVSTDLYLWPVASQPCRRNCHQKRRDGSIRGSRVASRPNRASRTQHAAPQPSSGNSDRTRQQDNKTTMEMDLVVLGIYAHGCAAVSSSSVMLLPRPGMSLSASSR
jgi:hypothetical protein